MDDYTTTSIEPDEMGAKKTISQSTEGGKSETPATKSTNDLTSQVEQLRWLMVGIVVVVAVGFILNLSDIYNYRYGYIKDRLLELEERTANLKKVSEEDLATKEILKCLKYKNYWEYDQCYK